MSEIQHGHVANNSVLRLRGARRLFVAAGLGAALLAHQSPSPLLAQEGARATRIVGEGISGDIDKHRRSPIVQVSPRFEGATVKLLVDAYQPNREFERYPLQFDFFINRKLFTSQVRSPELPGPIGVDIGPDIATPPFNYVIVAKVLHPNRTFTTVVQGAVFQGALELSLESCSVTEVVDGDDRLYVANSITGYQAGNDQLEIRFDAERSDGAEVLPVRLTLATNADEANGTIKLRGSQERAVSGSVTRVDNVLDALSMSSSNGAISVTCD